MHFSSALIFFACASLFCSVQHYLYQCSDEIYQCSTMWIVALSYCTSAQIKFSAALSFLCDTFITSVQYILLGQYMYEEESTDCFAFILLPYCILLSVFVCFSSRCY